MLHVGAMVNPKSGNIGRAAIDAIDMKQGVIDLHQIATDPERDTISGRPTGEAAREALNVPEVVRTSDVVTIVIPVHVRVVTPSFFIGMLAGLLGSARSIDEASRKFILVNATATTQDNLHHAFLTLLKTRTPYG